MFMKRVKCLKSLFIALGLLMYCNTIVVSQNKAVRTVFEQSGFSRSRLKGATNEIPSLSDNYCSKDGKITLSAPPNASADAIKWTIVGWDGATAVDYSTQWGAIVGTGSTAQYELDINKISSNYYTSNVDPNVDEAEKIYIGYQYFKLLLPINGASGTDYTSVYLKPTEFTLSGGAIICNGISTDLLLNDSELDIRYHLLDNGIDTGEFQDGDGGALVFTVTKSGKYSIVARNTLHNVCETNMSGEIDVVVHPLPVPVVTNSGPVCEGELLNLDETKGGFVSYNWTGPDGKMYSGQNITINSAQLTDNGTFTLSIEDVNGCTNSVTTDVIVYDTPSVVVANTGPVCVGGDVTVSSIVTGGKAPFNYTWVHVPSGTTYNTDAFTINNISAEDAGEYRLTLTDDNACAAVVASTILVVNNIPAVTLPLTATRVCEGEALTLTATPSGGSVPYKSYAWYRNGVLISGQTAATLTIDPTVAATHGGVYTVFVTDNNDCVSEESNANVVTILPAFSPIIDNNGPLCVGDRLELTRTSGAYASYSWTGPSGFTSTNPNPFIDPVSLAAAGTYTLTVIDGNGCTGTGTTDVIVNPNPTVTAANTGPVCLGGSVTISATPANGTAPYVYAWTHDATPLTETGDSFTLDPVTLADAGLYEVTVTDNNTCSSVAVGATALVVNDNPTVSVAYNNPACLNADLILTATPSGGSGTYNTYVWTKDAVVITGETGATLNINSAALTDAGEYGVTVTDNNGCSSAEGVVTVVINTPPIATATNNGPVCVGEPLQLTGGANGMLTYTWTGPNGFTDGTQSPVINSNATAAMAGTYQLEVYDGTCRATATTDVEVNVVNAILTHTPANFTVCENTLLNFSAIGQDGSGDYLFEFFVNGISQGAASTTNTIGLTITANVIVEVEVSDNINGCTDRASTNITMIANPTVTMISPKDGDAFCEGEPITFFATPGYDNYEFFAGPVASPTLLYAGPNDSYTHVAGFNTDTEFAVRATNVSGCQALSSIINVVINSRPIPNIKGELTVCSDTKEVYESNTLGLGKGAYTWIVNGGTPTGALDEETVEIVWDGSAPHSVSLNYINSEGCTALNPTVETITVNTVTAGLSADKTVICSDEDIIFTATGGDTYAFYVDLALVQGPDPSDTYIASGLASGQVVTVKAIDAVNCEDTHAGITITVNTTPNPVITAGPDVVCIGETATYVTEGGYLNYTWTVVGGTITSDPTLSSIDVLWNVDGAGSVSVSYESAGGGCVGAVFTLPVTVNTLPAGTDLTAMPSNNVIKGTDITFTAIGGDEYAFYKIDGGGVSTELQARSTTDYIVVSTEAPSANPVLVHGDIVRVVIYNAAGCSVFHEITVGVYDGITQFDVIASEPGHCFGENITSISLSGFQPDITYELFKIGTPDVSLGKILASGDVTTVKWGNVVGENPAAEFKVIAYYDGTPPTPPVEMNNTVFIEEYADLNVFNMSPTTAIDGPGACGTTTEITLDGSETDVDYLLLNGATIVAIEVGTNAPLNFGAPIGVGIYTIKAVHGITGCEKLMNGEWLVEGDPAIDTDFTIQATKDGKYCDDGTDAVTISLSSSQLGYDYELYFNNVPIVPTAVKLAGTGAALDFGTYTTEGNYSVVLENGGCTYYMTGSVSIEKVAMPSTFNLVADDNGHYCANDVDGVELSINISEPDIEYQLLLDGSPVGSPVSSTVSFGNHTQEGTYTVVASTSVPSLCTVTSNAVDVVMDPVPVILQFDGEDDFCEGGGSALLYINNPEADVTYELMFNDGTGYVPTGDNGTVNGSQIEWSVSAEGSYKVQAVKNNTDTNCGLVEMQGEKIITEISLPIDKVVDVIAPADPASCDGTIIKVLAPEAIMEYSVVSNITNAVVPGYTKLGNDVNGDGDIEFDPITDNGGLYRVEATNIKCTIVLTLGTGSVPDVTNISISSPSAVAKKQLVDPGSVCEGDGAVDIVLLDSDLGTNYDLYREISGGADVYIETIPGDGGDIIFTGILNEGTYYVIGYKDPVYDSTNTCNSEMLNRITVVFNPLPTSYRLIGSGLMCDDGTTITDATVGLEGSQADHKYRLILKDFVNGDRQVAEKTGDGNAIKFDVNEIGTYYVYAISQFGCTSLMEGEIEVTVVSGVKHQDLQAGDFTYCSNDPLGGYMLTLVDQEYGVVYTVLDESGSVVHQVTGGRAGASLELGLVSSGTYSILGSYDDNGACEVTLHTNVAVKTEPEKPSLQNYNLMYCFSDEGATINLTTTEAGIDYYIVDRITNNRISWLTGTGNAEEFTEKVGEGTYYVIAKSFATGCESESDDVAIVRYAELQLFNMMVGNTVVNDGETIVGAVNVDALGLNNSTSGVTYTLLKDEFLFTPTVELPGTGDMLDFGVQTDGGIYSIIAEENGCTRLMSGLVQLEVKPLVANDTLIAVPKGTNEQTVVVHENDDLESTVLDLLGHNIRFSIVDPEVNPNPDPNAADFTPFNVLETGAGNKVALDPNTGTLLMVKRPSYYGRDSVTYLIYNTEHTHRYDIATVYYFIGNADVDEENNLLIPNAFSPNGDEINDLFVISGSYGEGEESVSESKLEIFNRWGTVIYRSKGNKYGSDENWWDGTSNAAAMVSLGDKLPSGTYFYVYSITINDRELGTITKEFTGFIELRR